MKKIVLAGLGLAALSAPALAADLPLKAPPVAAVVYSWTGWYVGSNIGGGVQTNERPNELVLSGDAFPVIGFGTPIYGSPTGFMLRPAGVVGGAQAGYNWQTSTNFVFGIEADIQGSGIKDTNSCVFMCGVPLVTIPVFTRFPVVFATDSFGQRLDWFGTVRGRAGWTNGPGLFYVTGGLAYGDVERSGTVNGITLNPNGSTRNVFSGSMDVNSTKVGWTAGAGFEAKLTMAPNWSLKGEYLYVDLGKNTDSFSTFFTAGNPSSGQAALRTDYSTNRYNIFRLGLNYHFNGPVVAKY
jgi:outer membrane immunogenic protein